MIVEVAVLLALAVLVGAAMQRLTGMGFALVSAPFVVLIMGPVTGIVLVNVCGALSSLLILFRVLGHIDWKKYIITFIMTATVSLTVSLRMKPLKPESGVKPMLVAGATSGIMNTTAGVGGPAMSVYAVASKWGQQSFAATMQPYFLTVGLASILAKYVASPESMPRLEPWAWAAVAAAIVGGLVAGGYLHAVRAFWWFCSPTWERRQQPLEGFSR